VYKRPAGRLSAGSFIGGELLINGGNVLLSGSLSVMGGDGGNGLWAGGGGRI
jgi:hypothetical protein